MTYDAFDEEVVASPNELLTRAKVLEVLLQAIAVDNLDLHLAANYTSKPHYYYAAFPDVLLEEPFAKYVAYAADFDIVGGYADGTFRPGNNMTRAQVIKVIINLLEYLEAQS